MGSAEERSRALPSPVARATLAALVGVVGTAAQITPVFLPAELQHKAGNSYCVFEALGVYELATGSVPDGTYAGMSFRRPAVAGYAPGSRVELRIEVTPGLQFDARAVQTRVSRQGLGRVTAFDEVIYLPGVEAMPSPGVALVVPYDPLQYLVPFAQPVALSGSCWWTLTLASANRAWKVDGHDHRLFDDPDREPVAGPALQAAGANCGFLVQTPEPRFTSDYWNQELRFCTGVAPSTTNATSAGWLAALVVGSPLPAPLDLGGCLLRVDPTSGCVLPLHPAKSTGGMRLELRTPWRPGFDRLLIWTQAVVGSDAPSLWTSSMWASSPAPWAPAGFDINSSFVDSEVDPGHQLFPVTVLWRSAP